ncbi:MAG TPA: type IX secretion system outer membrane channel protein PorV [Flavipsychrobacter sp.]|nr:type IX secretion system outer membrane channel protein PorV [Flavipsychrobacter sp.]
MRGRIALIGLSIFSITALQSNAQGTGLNGQVNTITTGVPFLRISPDARSGGMGDVGIALSPDANSQYWNLGKIPFSQKKFGVSLTYTPWLRDLVPDISLAYVSGFAKFGKDDRQAVSASIRYFSLGDINFTGLDAQPIGTGKPREYAFDLGYSIKLSDYLSGGVGLRYIYSGLLTGLSSQSTANYKPGNTVAADVGFYYTKTKEVTEFKSNTLSLGVAVTNLGGKISYDASNSRRDFLPINLGLGAAYNMKVDEYNQFTIALDINKLLVPTPLDSSTTPGVSKYYIPNKSVVSGVLGSFGDAPGGFSEELKEFQISLGAEYWYQNQFAVRAGYFYENKLKGDRKYLTLGVGVRYKVFQLNGSYLVPSGTGITRNPLSNTFRFSLMFEFDKIETGESSE